MYGCGNHNGSTSTIPTSTIRGYAIEALPIVGATVSLYDTKGNLFFSKKDVTTKGGTFLLKVPTERLQEDFLIEVSGGTVGQGGSVMNSSLQALIHEYNASTYSYYVVGPVSTLIARYSKAHPEMAYEDAVNKVMHFLDISGVINPDTDLLSPQETVFDDKQFLADAATEGGLDNFISTLIADIDAGKVMDYSKEPPVQGIAGGVAGSVLGMIAKNLITNAVLENKQNLDNAGFGWVCKIVLGDPDPTDTAILNELNTISSQLDNIQGELVQLNQSIQDAKTQILLAIQQTNYNAEVDTINPAVSTIEALTKRLQFDAAGDPTDPAYQADTKDTINQIQAANVPALLTQVQNALIGIAGSTGIMNDWGSIITSRSYQSPYDFHQQMQDQFAYWIGIQLDALTLILENEHNIGGPDAIINGYVNQYLTGVEAQSQYYVKWLAAHMAFLEDTNYSPAFPFDGDWQSTSVLVANGTDYSINGVYTGSPTVEDAQVFIGKVLNRQPHTVVWVYASSGLEGITSHEFSYLYQPDLLVGPPLYLQNVSTGTTFPYKTQTILNFPYPTTDWSGYAESPPQVQYVLFDYGVLPDGQYKMVGNDSYDARFLDSNDVFFSTPPYMSLLLAPAYTNYLLTVTDGNTDAALVWGWPSQAFYYDHN